MSQIMYSGSVSFGTQHPNLKIRFIFKILCKFGFVAKSC